MLGGADERPSPGAAINQPPSRGSTQGVSFSILVMNWGFPAWPRVQPPLPVAWDLCLGRRKPSFRVSGEPKNWALPPGRTLPLTGPSPGSSFNVDEEGALTACRVTLGHPLPFSGPHSREQKG